MEFQLGGLPSKECHGLHEHGPCAGREIGLTQLYTSLIVKVILRLYHMESARLHLVWSEGALTGPDRVIPDLVITWFPKWLVVYCCCGKQSLVANHGIPLHRYLLVYLDDQFINLEEYLFVPTGKAKMGAMYCASLLIENVMGRQRSENFLRIDSLCVEENGVSGL